MCALRALVLPLCLTACAAGESTSTKDDTGATDGATWEELEDGEDTGADDEDDKGDDEDKDDDYPPCGDEVVDGEACEGDYTTTTCLDAEQAYWWCEDGAWTSEK